MASLQLDDSIHNLLILFFLNRRHSTIFLNKTSSALSINSSVIQGSVLSPSSRIINASSLKPLNKMIKFADDTYLVIPSSSNNFLLLELDSLSEWAKLSNFSLHLKKSYKLIIYNYHNKITPPSLHPHLQRTSSLTILGVSFTETLNITPHIDNIINKCYQTFQALKIIWAHGLDGPKLYDITEYLIISRVKYATPSTP